MKLRDMFSVDELKLDPDRDDFHDVANKLMPTLVRMAYTHLVADKVAHEKRHGPHDPSDEDSMKFEFTKSELEDRLETLVRSVNEKLRDLAHDEKFINSVASEFNPPLED